MNYTIDIVDTLDDSHVLSLEHAEARSLLLRWNGSGEKDGEPITGSTFSFTMEVNLDGAVDGAFRHLFTGSETRYKVIIYLTDTPAVIVWTGFILPEMYSEPYVSGSFYPSFEAVDGLGRLKGKYLPQSFYEVENSVVGIIAACLLRTGLELPLNLAPAIENVTVKDYNLIYLSGSHLLEGERRLDCYSILENILNSMVCVAYQSNNEWWVEGINRRHMGVVPFKRYDFAGVYVEDHQYTKLKKNFNGLDQPFVTVVPPYNEIYVAHDRVAQSLPETIAQESNENWAIGQGVDGDIHPTHWFGRGNFYASALSPNYKVSLRTLDAATFNNNFFIGLKNKIYVRQYDKFVFSATFKSEVSAELETGITPNGFRLFFTLNGAVIYSVERVFEKDTINMDFDLFMNTAGLLDLRIVQPFFGGNIQDGTASSFITIEKLELKATGFKEVLSYTDVINQDFSKNKDIDLTFSDDASGFSKAFRFSKLEVRGPVFNTLSVPVLYGRTFQGRYYSIVSLRGANLIADNRETVRYDGNDIQILNVFYNWSNGEEMVVETVSAIGTGNFEVLEYNVVDVAGDRSYWEQWTDVVYPIEQDRYNESVAKVFRRLFINAHERVEYLAEGAYKFNDLIRFDYILPADYFITNLIWDMDRGTSQITMIKCIYQNEIVDVGTANIPPLCNAGPDVVLPSNFGTFQAGIGFITHTHTTATAFDPDGFIARWSWAIIAGNDSFGIVSATSQFPIITNFLGNEITLQLTVRDNDGATAQDTVRLTKPSVHTFSLVEHLYVNVDGSASAASGGLAYKRDTILFSPDLFENEILTIRGNFTLRHLQTDPVVLVPMVPGVTSFLVEKNGVAIINNVLSGLVVERLGDFEFSYVNGDIIRITVQCFTLANVASSLRALDLFAGYEINNMLFQQGSGNITGYPVSQQVTYTGVT